MKIIFHIGMPKTGTTSLQFFLSKNREALLSQGDAPKIYHAHPELRQTGIPPIL